MFLNLLKFEIDKPLYFQSLQRSQTIKDVSIGFEANPIHLFQPIFLQHKSVEKVLTRFCRMQSQPLKSAITF